MSNVQNNQDIQFSEDYATYLIVCSGIAGEVYDTDAPRFRLATAEGNADICTSFASGTYFSGILFGINKGSRYLKVANLDPTNSFNYAYDLEFKSGMILTLLRIRVINARVDVYVI